MRPRGADRSGCAPRDRDAAVASRTSSARFERIDVEDAPPAVLDAAKTVPGVVGITTDGDTARIEFDREDAAGAVLKLLVDAGVTSIQTTRPSLEEVYLHMFGERGLKV